MGEPFTSAGNTPAISPLGESLDRFWPRNRVGHVLAGGGLGGEAGVGDEEWHPSPLTPWVDFPASLMWPLPQMGESFQRRGFRREFLRSKGQCLAWHVSQCPASPKAGRVWAKW